MAAGGTGRSWLIRHAQNAVGALGALWRNPLASGLTVLVIGIALSLPAALHVLVQNGRAAAGTLSETRDFSVYLDPGLAEADAAGLRDELGRDERIGSVRLVSPDDALAEMRREPAYAAALDALDANPLPHTLIVRPAEAAGPEEIRRLAEETGRREGVDVVKLDTEWLLRLHAILDFVRRLVLIAGLLLATAVVVVVGNTIRLEIQNRAAEIEVVKLLGGTDAFVRRPFLWLGFWYGLLGAIVGMLVLAAALIALSEPVGRLAGLYGRDAGLGAPGADTLLALVGGGVLAGLAGAWTAVARHLSAIQPRV